MCFIVMCRLVFPFSLCALPCFFTLSQIELVILGKFLVANCKPLLRYVYICQPHT